MQETERGKDHFVNTTESHPFLTPKLWEKANRHLVSKAIAELSHERILTPTQSDLGEYVLVAEGGDSYRFRARRFALEHWHIDPESITRASLGGETEPVDALAFIVDFADVLGISPTQLPVYLEELSSTLSSWCFKNSKPHVTALELAQTHSGTGYQQVEGAMSEGHPCFIANNGRLGLSASEYRAFAPETEQPVVLVWLALHRSRAQFFASEELDYPTLMDQELGELRGEFEEVLNRQGLNSDDYLFMPVHPWQWDHKVHVTFAAEIAQQWIVYVGTSRDRYRAQQSIRTFFNTDNPERHYVKTALSVLNMGFMRGLSSEYMRATPAINDWLYRLVAEDEFWVSRGFTILRERAAIGYTNSSYTRATQAGSPYRKMLAGLWRESPISKVGDDEQIMTMAALLHRDSEGVSVVSQLIARSGLSAQSWVQSYLRAYFQPVLHALMHYELAFMPHGENVILVLKDGCPVRIFMKDIGEEIMLMGKDIDVEEKIARIRMRVPEEARALSIFTDVFDCFFRFLGSILDTDEVLAEDDFWECVATSIREYLAEAEPRFASRYDLFVPRFALSCLNRLQLRNNEQMLDLEDQSQGLVFEGELENPVARFARRDAVSGSPRPGVHTSERNERPWP